MELMTSMACDNNLFTLKFNWLVNHVHEPRFSQVFITSYFRNFIRLNNVHLAHAKLLFNVHEKPFVTDGKGSRSLTDPFSYFFLYSIQSQRVRSFPSLTAFMKYCSHQLTTCVVKTSQPIEHFSQYTQNNNTPLWSHTLCWIPLWWIRKVNR